jgi:hypothetical protein
MVEGKGMNIDDLLRDREATHGTFEDTATIAQTLKILMRRARNWDNLPPASKEALELMATKAARILNGDATNADHWNDIAGYARLRANAFAPGYRRPAVTDDVEAGISSIAKRLRPIVPARVNDEGGAA